jgi:peptidoglycan lytic transglycosylase
MSVLLASTAIACASSSSTPRNGAGSFSPPSATLERTRPAPHPSLPTQLAAGTHPWERCTVVWYGEAMHGRITASGARFNAWGLTAAHRTLPFGTRVELTWEHKRVTVTITDRGPIRKDRCFDLSAGAFQRLAPLSVGVLRGVAWRRV